jgi:hypothetical protein
MKLIQLYFLFVFLVVILNGCINQNNSNYSDAKEITTEKFFALRMENRGNYAKQPGWFIKHIDSNYVYIAYKQIDIFSDKGYHWTKYRKSQRNNLEKNFPAYLTLDGSVISRKIWDSIIHIQDKENDEMLKKYGQSGISQNFNWFGSLKESNIIGKIIWKYTVYPVGTKRYFEYEFTISKTGSNDFTIKQKNLISNKVDGTGG